MESALLALLTGHAPITSLVGLNLGPSPAAGRSIYWNAVAQGAKRPAVVLFKITGAEGLTHGGPDGLSGNIVQIDVQALTVTSMWAIRDAIIAKLHGYSDATFRLIQHDSERQSAEELAGAGSLIHRASLDFSIWAAA